jgi:DNA-binding IclR family transcriptional regulator
MSILMIEKRSLIARVIIDTMRVYSRAYWKDENIGEHAIDILIGLAIMIGEAEGRPMSATDVAAYVGIPRATVIRHLHAAQADGLAATVSSGKRQTLYSLRCNDLDVLAELAKLFDRYAKLCAELSKLDDK